MTPLCDLADKHQTDKGGRHAIYAGSPCETCHNYTPAYHKLLGHRRDQVRRVLEVGVNAGCSLRMWEEYFPIARIVGFDIRENSLFTAGRIECHYADQGDRESLVAAVQAAGGGPFDLIVDDGSHQAPHQIVTAETLLPLLAADGVFVIEDIDIDCRPELLADQIRMPAGFAWRPVACGVGIGGAHCRPGCQFCGGQAGETLIVIERTT